MKKPRVNPHCSVPGCRTKQRHSDDRIVQGVMAVFSTPAKLLSVTRTAMEQLMASIENDLTKSRHFSWMTRIRQPEEMYFRALYVLFIADADERLHIFSGNTPKVGREAKDVLLFFQNVHRMA